ncbi:MAG: hypothetical protein ABR977_12070 [Candidatus Dormibacteria bacterium]|jgi:hypothetical protein
MSDRIYLRVVLELIEDRPLSQGGARNLGPVWAELWEPPEGCEAVQEFRTLFHYVTAEGAQHFMVSGPAADFGRRDAHDLGAWPPMHLGR